MASDLTEQELGMVQVTLTRFNRDVLPALKDMKARVDNGEVLHERETEALEKAIKRSVRGREFAKKHPEYKTLVDSANDLYKYVATKSAENAEANGD